MVIRPADPIHDAQAVAGLIYDTDPYLFPFLFGRRQAALPVLQQLFQLEGNSFSHRHVQVAEDGGDVAGMLIGYVPQDINKEAEATDFRRVLDFWQQLLLRPKFWLLEPFLDKSEIDGRYIQNVCVAPAHRGKGIGSGLIRHFCSMSQDTVWLDVEMGNKANRAMYEHMGFRVVREIPIFLPGLGSIRMARQSEQGRALL
ncbi:MAG: GNAT family N-acetyltransferase [Spirochaetota bacterium]